MLLLCEHDCSEKPQTLFSIRIGRREVIETCSQRRGSPNTASDVEGGEGFLWASDSSQGGVGLGLHLFSL